MNPLNGIQIQSCDTGSKGTGTNRSPSINWSLFRKLCPLISVKLTCVKRSPLLRVAVTFSVVPTSSRPVVKTTSYPSYCLHLGYSQIFWTRLNKEVLTGLKYSSSQIRWNNLLNLIVSFEKVLSTPNQHEGYNCYQNWSRGVQIFSVTTIRLIYFVNY